MTGTVCTFDLWYDLVGDWHCAYVLLYGPRVLEVDEDELKEYQAQKAAEKEEESKKEATESKDTPKDTPMDAS